jgi:hypothetical protein
MDLTLICWIVYAAGVALLSTAAGIMIYETGKSGPERSVVAADAITAAGIVLWPLTILTMLLKLALDRR